MIVGGFLGAFPWVDGSPLRGETGDGMTSGGGGVCTTLGNDRIAGSGLVPGSAICTLRLSLP